MSTKSRHYHPATRCSEATGMSYERCTVWQRDGRISVGQPVPDGGSPGQRSFEARIAHRLAETVRDRQIGHAVLGITKVEPWPNRLVLHLDSAMAWRVMAGLLSADGDDGLRGVPGLRPHVIDGDVLLRHIGTGAEVMLAGRASELPYSLRAASAHARVRTPDEPMGEDEQAEQVAWDTTGVGRRAVRFSEARDYLLSRVLRRPLVINRAGLIHNQVNTYSHGDDDLVVQWCCGTLVGQLAETFLASGLCSIPSVRGTAWRRTTRQDLVKEYPDRTIALRLGPAQVTLMSAAVAGTESCRDDDIDFAAYRAKGEARARKWYADKPLAGAIEGAGR